LFDFGVKALEKLIALPSGGRDAQVANRQIIQDGRVFNP